MHYRGYKDLECYIQTRLLMIFISELVFKLINGYISYLEKSKKQLPLSAITYSLSDEVTTAAKNEAAIPPKASRRLIPGSGFAWDSG